MIKTAHGEIETPVFMPVGTNATVKSLDKRDIEDLQAAIILGNTYHLYLQPGSELIAKAGGLHKFMNWNGAVLTDSGGFQVFSLNDLRKIKESGVEFRSHRDGSKHFFTPSKVIDIQKEIGADIIMSFDECPPADATYKEVKKAVERTSRWAYEGFERFHSTSNIHDYKQYLFAIIQGGAYEDLREKSLTALLEKDFDGFAIGGLSVGEKKEDMYRITAHTAPLLPKHKPRYLMGVGTPCDILESIENGIDMFDCVYPTRNARNGTLYTWQGKAVLRNSFWKNELSNPISPECRCFTCTNFSAGYVHHLFKAEELLAFRLATIHNLHFYLELARQARVQILQNNFEKWKQETSSKLEEIIKF